MDSRLILLLFSAIFATSLAKNDFWKEVVVTSADVVNGRIENIGKTGDTYRLYAIASIDAVDDLVKQVLITDSRGKTFKLNNLFGKKDVYFLSENNIVTGPVTVLDPTKNGLTYTIYLVSTRVPALPVADITTSSPRMSFDSNDYNAQGVRGMTILSADNHFTMRKFEFTENFAYIIPRGYDLQSSRSQDSVLFMNRQYGPSSYVTIFGPIATIRNKGNVDGHFKIGYDFSTTAVQLSPGASLSFLSPNWLSLDDQYSTSFIKYTEAFDRSFDFGKDTPFDFSISASSLKKGQVVSLEVTNDKGEKELFKYDSPDEGEHQYSATGRKLHLIVNVNPNDSPATYPRFIVSIAS